MTPLSSEKTVFDSIIESAIQKERSKYGEKPIFLTDDDRRRIEKAIGANVSTPEELVSRIERAMTVQIGDVHVPLTPYLLDRLYSRAIRVPFDEFIKITIKRLLEEFCGLR